MSSEKITFVVKEDQITVESKAIVVSSGGGGAVSSVFGRTGHVVAEPGDYSKSDVGLDQVDNTSDLDKPISTATQGALDDKADDTALQTHVNDANNPHSVTKDQVGLGNVDNTSDTDKPISTATQAALDDKADDSALQSHVNNTSNPHSTDIGNLRQGTLAELNNAITDGNVDDLTKPRTPLAHAVTHKNGGADAVKLDELAYPDDNTNLNATTSAHGLLPKLSGSSTEALRGDGTWGSVGSGDMNKATYDPAGINEQLIGETATQTLTNKTLNSPTINTPTGITKSDVGLDQVDNTSDADKPISTATQTELDTINSRWQKSGTTIKPAVDTDDVQVTRLAGTDGMIPVVDVNGTFKATSATLTTGVPGGSMLGLDIYASEPTAPAGENNLYAFQKDASTITLCISDGTNVFKVDLV